MEVDAAVCHAGVFRQRISAVIQYIRRMVCRQLHRRQCAGGRQLVGQSDFYDGSFFNGVAMGAGIVIARWFGAKEYDTMRKSIYTAIAFGLVVGVVLTVTGIGLTPVILRWMRTPDEVFPESVAYFRYYFLGAIFVVMYNIFVGILHAVGDSRHPLLSSIIFLIYFLKPDWIHTFDKQEQKA